MKSFLSFKTIDEQINEVLSKDADAGAWISDFVKSDDPKFAGKSAAKRKEMALAAYYAKQKNESNDAWAASEEKRREKEALARLSSKDQGTLSKVRDMLAKEKKPAKNEAVKQVRGDDSLQYEETELDEASRAETGELFKGLVDKAHASSQAGNHTQAKRHLANAQTARYGILAKHMNKHQASFDKYKELKHSYTNSDEPVREEVEELDELSKKTLGSYVKAAAQDAERSGRDQEHYGDQSDYDRGTKRQKGIAKAVDKLAKEEVEELDELSNKLLNRYSKKAEKEAGKHFMAADRAQDRGNYDKAQTNMDKADKRASGVYRAQSKIKEDNITEEHLVHVDTGEKYGKVSHPKDIEHVRSGIDKHGAEFAGNTDKGIVFKFKNAQSAIDFKNHTNKSPHKSMHADLTESVQIDEISKDTLTSYAHKAFAQGNDLHYDLAHSKGNKATDAERQAIKDKISKRNAGVIKAAQKMNKEDMDEAVDTVKRDEKGKVIAWSHEGDWQKMSSKNKQGSGKAANLAGKAMQKTKQLSKEEVEEDINESAWGRDKMASLRQAHDRHMEKALAANKAGDDTAVKTHQRKMQMIQGKMQKLKQNEEVELGEECEILSELSKGTMRSYLEKGITKGIQDTFAGKGDISKKRKDGLNKAMKKVYGEEVEELDELSKGTLKSYVGKAVQSHGKNRVMANMAWDKSEEPGDLLDKLGHKALKDSKKRSIGIAKAVDKLTKEEVEEFMQTEAYDQLDEVDKKTLGNYVKKAHDQLMKHTSSVNFKGGRGDKDAFAYAHDPVAVRKTANRTKGMNQAISRLTKEEVEEFMQTEAYDQLDEISKDTLKSYVHKAATDIGFRGMDAGRQAGNPEDKAARSKNFKTMSKRVSGIDKAANRLAKEDTMLTYSEFMAQLAEGKADDLRDKLAADRERRLDKYDYSKEKDSKVSLVKNVKGHSYGAGEDSEEGEDDVKTAKPAAVKRGRGRPAGSKSGARV